MHPRSQRQLETEQGPSLGFVAPCGSWPPCREGGALQGVPLHLCPQGLEYIRDLGRVAGAFI